jgi:uncharacterized membrane protein HdeD (DUF308 family)
MQSRASNFRTPTDSWWMWLVRGIVAIILAVLAFVQPGATLAAFTLLLGAYFLVDGVISVAHGFGQQPAGQSRWPLLFWGVIGVLAGLTIFTQPLYRSVFTLTLVVGVWAIVTGVMAIITGIRLRDEIDSEWWLIGGGIASIVFGVLLWTNVAAGALSIAFLIGFWALIFGILEIVLSFRIKAARDRRTAPAPA